MNLTKKLKLLFNSDFGFPFETLLYFREWIFDEHEYFQIQTVVTKFRGSKNIKRHGLWLGRRSVNSDSRITLAPEPTELPPFQLHRLAFPAILFSRVSVYNLLSLEFCRLKCSLCDKLIRSIMKNMN